MNDQVHHSAASGYKAAADTYVKVRPDYPPGGSGWLTTNLGLDGHKTVIDLGASTGKFTGRLVATGAQVIAVELPGGQRAQVDEEIRALIATESRNCATGRDQDAP